jgi:hypothetical protein
MDGRQKNLERTWAVLQGIRKIAGGYDLCPKDMTLSDFEAAGQRIADEIQRKIDRERDVSTARWKAIKAIMPYLGKEVPENERAKFDRLRKELQDALDGMTTTLPANFHK